MTFGTDIYDPLRMTSNDFSDPLSFHVMPPAGQSSHLIEISHLLLDGLAQHFAEMFMFKPYDLGDTLTFYIKTASGQPFKLSCRLLHDQTRQVPSASAVYC